MSFERYFFVQRPFDEEIRKKVDSLSVPVAELARALGVFLRQHRGFTAGEVRELESLVERSEGALDTSDRAEYENYQSHPLRVAASFAYYFENIAPEDMRFALCHNAIELDVLDRIGRERLGVRACRLIEILTIDRNREEDQVYLARYYDAIAAEGDKLMVLKALDKLDNTLWWVRFDVEARHARVVLDHVVPRMTAGHAALAAYLRDVTPYTLLESTKARFRTTAGDPGTGARLPSS